MPHFPPTCWRVSRKVNVDLLEFTDSLCGDGVCSGPGGDEETCTICPQVAVVNEPSARRFCVRWTHKRDAIGFARPLDNLQLPVLTSHPAVSSVYMKTFHAFCANPSNVPPHYVWLGAVRDSSYATLDRSEHVAHKNEVHGLCAIRGRPRVQQSLSITRVLWHVVKEGKKCFAVTTVCTALCYVWTPCASWRHTFVVRAPPVFVNRIAESAQILSRRSPFPETSTRKISTLAARYGIYCKGRDEIPFFVSTSSWVRQVCRAPC